MLTASEAQVILSAVPVASAAIGVTWLGEELGPMGWLGGGLIAAASVVGARASPGAEGAAHAHEQAVTSTSGRDSAGATGRPGDRPEALELIEQPAVVPARRTGPGPDSEPAAATGRPPAGIGP